ncbi:MAG TPA: M23 family metallopeptidase, partial [Gemmatimonadales bacterium]|nr:M23 family metallopeptidase [Gemmatimonadales bacterium]
DSSGWGVHVLTARQDRDGGVWVGTYGEGIFHLAPDSSRWRRIRSDTTDTSISWDFVHAFGFGPGGEIWYGTVGNGWGLSTDGGRTWKNWTFSQLGPEWQYVTPDGIVTSGDTTIVATADGLQITTDNGASWTAIIDSIGPAAKGPADTALALLPNEYVLGMARASRGRTLVRTLHGGIVLTAANGTWRAVPDNDVEASAGNLVFLRRRSYVRSPCGLHPAQSSWSCTPRAARNAPRAPAPTEPRTTWFRRPIDQRDNPLVDQTYRYGSTMGGNFQQHQGIEFNNPDGTPVRAIGSGTVVYAGPAERGALTVAIRHDSTLTTPDGRLVIHSVYYHNNQLLVSMGDRVEAGALLARVGHTGRATNDHLHLEVHASPTDSVQLIVDSLQRFPPYSTNPELWIESASGMGIVAGQVWDSAGNAVPGARIYGLRKREPRETPFSYAETYRDRAHPHPLYREHFAVGSVPPGDYVLGTSIDGRRVWRRVRVEPGKVSWVEFR